MPFITFCPLQWLCYLYLILTLIIFMHLFYVSFLCLLSLGRVCAQKNVSVHMCSVKKIINANKSFNGCSCLDCEIDGVPISWVAEGKLATCSVIENINFISFCCVDVFHDQGGNKLFSKCITDVCVQQLLTMLEKFVNSFCLVLYYNFSVATYSYKHYNFFFVGNSNCIVLSFV